MDTFWDIAALGNAHIGQGPLIAPVEAKLREMSAEERQAFHDWAHEIDQRLRTRAHHEVAALCFGTRSTRDFDLLRTWWAMQGKSLVDTLASNPQTAAELPAAEMKAEIGETLARAAAAVAAAAEGEPIAAAPESPWPAVTTPFIKLAARHRRAADVLDKAQGPLWSGADLLRHTGRPVEALAALVKRFRKVADGGERQVIGSWGIIEGQPRPSRQAVDRQGQPVVIPASLFVYFRASKDFAAALAGEGDPPKVDSAAAHLFAAMLESGEGQLRVEIPHCALLRIYATGNGRRLVRTRPAPELFERANRTAVATDPGAGQRLFAPTPMGAPNRNQGPAEEQEAKGVIGRVLNLFGL